MSALPSAEEQVYAGLNRSAFEAQTAQKFTENARSTGRRMGIVLVHVRIPCVFSRFFLPPGVSDFVIEYERMCKREVLRVPERDSEER